MKVTTLFLASIQFIRSFKFQTIQCRQTKSLQSETELDRCAVDNN